MPSFWMLTGNTVENLIVADDKAACEEALRCVLVEVTDENPAGMGWSYDPDTGRFTPPADQPAE